MASAERSSSKNTSNGEIIDHSDNIDLDNITVGIETSDAPAAEANEGRFLDFLKAQPSKKWLQEAGVKRGKRYSPLALLQRTAPNLRRHVRVPFVRKIRWRRLYASFTGWIKHPKNVAFFLWLVAVFAGLLMLLLLMVGAFNSLITQSSRRKDWIEATNQVINALFTIMCLYQHPILIHQLLLLLRWTPQDAAVLRGKYCKYTAARTRERLHLFIVIGLLNLTCIAQYVYCGLYLGYSRTTRPDDAVTICIAIGIGSPIVASIYTVKGPLGRKGEVVSVETPPEPIPERGADGQEKQAVAQPQWIGGLFDCWDDPTVFCSSIFCTFCVFGWNMERLGFGNMYVHVATFVLLCIAPFLVFAGAGFKIDNDAVQAILAGTGAVMSILGLLYGGFWRIQMRKKFRLPVSKRCCGHAGTTDCSKWLFCWPCALAQEVRTGNYYDVEDYSFYVKESSEGSGSGSAGQVILSPLPREGVEGGGEMVAPEVVVVVEEEDRNRRE